MKATIEIPDDLYRKVQAKSEQQGRPLGDVAVELFDAWVSESGRHETARPSVGALMADVCGSIDSGVTDLSTNPAHLEGLGRAPARDH